MAETERSTRSGSRPRTGAGTGRRPDGTRPDGSDRWRIDRSGPYPLYFQLKQALLHVIDSQGLRPGDRLPTEAEIEDRFGVSRTTIRQALSELVLEGVVERVQGKGTFVSAGKVQHVAMLTSFTDNMRAQGYRPSRRVLRQREAPAPAEVSTALGIVEGAQCWHIERLLLADERPMGLAVSWVPMQALSQHPDALARLGEGSLYEVLQSPPLSLVLHRGVETITAGVMDAAVAEFLGAAPGSSALVVRRTTWLPGGRPVEWTRMTFPSDRYEYRVELSRPDNG